MSDEDRADSDDPADTRSEDYAARLRALEGAPWKRRLDVQAPYRWNVRRLGLGFALDVGCGIGRNLRHLGTAVGIDHNPASVALARERGCVAFTPEAFLASEHAVPGRFDGLLFAHVLEHMTGAEATAFVGEHLRWLRSGGRVALIAPQEAGFRSDPTHVDFLDAERLEAILRACGLALERSFSFPFPRLVGRVFPHNEFVVVGRKP